MVQLRPGTFSIAAQDPETGAFGVAVSTALVGVGALCPFVSENAAVATQSFDTVSNWSIVVWTWIQRALRHTLAIQSFGTAG